MPRKTVNMFAKHIAQNKLHEKKGFRQFSKNLRVDNLSCQSECSNFCLKVSGPYLLSYSNNNNSKLTSVLFSCTFPFKGLWLSVHKLKQIFVNT